MFEGVLSLKNNRYLIKYHAEAVIFARGYRDLLKQLNFQVPGRLKNLITELLLSPTPFHFSSCLISHH